MPLTFVYHICMKLNTQKILNEMARLGWNQKRLAEVMGEHRGRVSHILKHQPENMTLKTVDKFARALACDPKDLLI